MWYYVKADPNYRDTAPVGVEVKISPADRSALNAAIAEAETCYNGIRDDYADIAATLKTAIETAKAVAGNDNTTESAVADAITALDGAVDAAKADVKKAEEEKEAEAKKATDEAAANSVIDKITALPASAGLGDKAAVEAARAAYDALTEDQKALVPADVVAKLTNAEAQVEDSGEEAAKIDIGDCTITVKDQTYTGKAVTAKAMKAAVTVKYGKKTLENGTDYSLTYDKALKAVGPATVTVKGMGQYRGSKKLNFNIVPKGTAFTKLTGDKLKITLKWKNPNNITGYQIEYSLKADFKSSETVKISKAKTLTTTIKKLMPGKTYYVRIRTCKTVNKKSYYSEWSKAKTVKTLAGKIGIGDCEITVKNVTYTGKVVTAKAMKEAVIVKYGKTTLKAGTDYTLSYDKKLRAIGPATVTVKGKGICTGSKKMTFNIVPKGTKFSKLIGSKQSITLKWKNPNNITGYQIQYGLKADFKGAKNVDITKAKTLSTTIKKLKENETYYVRIRTYATAEWKKYYSDWSEAETVKTGTGEVKNEADVQRIEADVQGIEAEMNSGEELDLPPLLPVDDVALPEEMELPGEMELPEEMEFEMAE